jgi:hypothetical protein
MIAKGSLFGSRHNPVFNATAADLRVCGQDSATSGQRSGRDGVSDSSWWDTVPQMRDRFNLR